MSDEVRKMADRIERAATGSILSPVRMAEEFVGLRAEVERLRSELASEREARERAEADAEESRLRADEAEGSASAAERLAILEHIAMVHDIHAHEPEHAVAMLVKERDDLRARLEHVAAENADLRARLEQAEASEERLAEALANLDGGVNMVRVDVLDETRGKLERAEAERDAQAAEVASLKRELAAARAVTESDERLIAGLWAAVHNSDPGCNLKTSAHARLMGRDGANAVFEEVTVDYQNGKRPGIYPVVTPAGSTSALDSYVADATADLRERVAELEGTAAQVCGDVREMARLGNVRLPEPILWLEDILPDEAKRPSEDMPVEAADFSPRSWQRRIAAARAEGERAGEERAADIAEAARDFLVIIDKAGLLNLSGGVQLGQTSWYAKASDARELLVDVLRNFGERARPSTKEEDGHAEDTE